MKYIFSQEQLTIPEGVKIHIRSRIITVEGPRGMRPSITSCQSSLTLLAGKLTKDLSHIAVTFSLPPKTAQGKDVIQIEIHHGSRKNVATLRTVKSIIQNLITGVTRGYKYKMRYVYAHFPINVNIEKVEDNYEVEIRYASSHSKAQSIQGQRLLCKPP